MNKNRIVMIGVFVLLFAFVLCGCYIPGCNCYGCDRKDVDGQFDGLSCGFNYSTGVIGAPLTSKIDCGVRSKQTVFNINNVTLDFYIGWHRDGVLSGILDVNDTRLIFYFYEKSFNPYDAISGDNPEPDYKKIEGMHYAGEVTMSEFCSQEFYVEMTKKDGKIYKKSFRLTVPAKLFGEKKRAFYFGVFYADRNTRVTEETWPYIAYSRMIIEFSFLEADTIRLERASIQ